MSSYLDENSEANLKVLRKALSRRQRRKKKKIRVRTDEKTNNLFNVESQKAL